MSSKCFVPNCKTTVGVLFPEDPADKKKWLESLKIKHVLPNPTSFVCLEHFEDADVIQNEETSTVREGAVPSKINVKKLDTEDDVPTSEELCQNTTTDNERTDEVQMTGTPDVAETDSIDMLLQDIPEDDYNTEDSSKDVPCSDDTNESNMKHETEFVLDLEEKKTCRLCGQEKSNTKNIFEEKVENIPVSVAIMECIYPLEITRFDKLSKDICPECLECINSYFKFRTICLENDKKYGGEEHLLEEQNSIQEHSNQKRKLEPTKPSTHETKKPRQHKIFIDSDDEYDDFDSLASFLVKKEMQSPKLKPTTSSQICVTQSEASINEKFDRVEEELRRVLEGQLTEEQARAENIIIHVENDEEKSTDHNVAVLSKLQLPIVIKPVETKAKKVTQGISKRKSTETACTSPVLIKGSDNSEVALPKGINVKVKESYKSEIGVYESIPLSYIFGQEFCQINEYLFEYRLCKGNVRFLRCVIPSCPALGVQNRINPGEYSTEITVTKPHNHRPPTEIERKKRMFYFVMKHKMQSDKTLNFRNVYDEVCKQDPEIKDLVPLRNVINEICRHQLTYKTPVITSFEHFYDHIEEDMFQKLHFTHNGVQFYQERFMIEDGSKAVVFANSDIIDQVSYSSLMYIDASFKFDTSEEFKYQLVTVLVWIEESYYPVLYALVNKKTQEIYKKIFEYLHDDLAPKLRPREIVTDYEANLYYALGETYLDSAIGGSVFYYTQNLYKKICALNLSRDLETNSYFRNIYHMLLMLPLLPVNTILDGLNNMEIQARDLGLNDLTRPIFDHVRTEWMMKVTPDLFCVHRLENRINENVIAPFKKLRDFMLSKGKMQKQHTTIVTVVEKLIELEHFLQITYSAPNKKSFARDLSSSQKKNVLKAWQYIESHPKININNFFSKVLGYIKCMENQLWIWGFYRYNGDISEELINATNFSIMPNDVEIVAAVENGEHSDDKYDEIENEVAEEGENGQLVMEAVIDENGGFVLQNGDSREQGTPFENAFLKYVYKE